MSASMRPSALLYLTAERWAGRGHDYNALVEDFDSWPRRAKALMWLGSHIPERWNTRRTWRRLERFTR